MHQEEPIQDSSITQQAALEASTGIFVKLLSGQTLTLDVSRTDTISSLKEKIKAKQPFEGTQQQLIYGGNSLFDERTIGDYDIPNEATVYLLTTASQDLSLLPSPNPLPQPVYPHPTAPPMSPPTAPPMQRPGPAPTTIQVKVKMNTATQLLIDVNLNDRVQVLVEKIKSQIALESGKTIILYAGQHALAPEKTITEEGVTDHAILYMVTTALGGCKN